MNRGWSRLRGAFRGRSGSSCRIFAHIASSGTAALRDHLGGIVPLHKLMRELVNPVEQVAPVLVDLIVLGAQPAAEVTRKHPVGEIRFRRDLQLRLRVARRQRASEHCGVVARVRPRLVTERIVPHRDLLDGHEA
jgi:hypothetical protein